MAVGVVPLNRLMLARADVPGSAVMYVGSSTGRDGIHGATFASEALGEDSEEKRPNVQIGDPFMEKLLIEATLEAIETGAILGLQDMGAAGLTCTTCEPTSKSGTGVDIEVTLVPRMEQGMTPYEVMLSESQERMLLVAEKGREEEVFRVFRKWGLDAVTIGVVTGDNLLRVKDHGVVVAEIPNPALTDEAPVYDRPHDTPPYRTAPFDPPVVEQRQMLTADLERLLASGDVCSKRWIWEQYDYQVRTNTVQGPGSDAAVIRIKETGTSIAMALDGNGRYCSLNPREGTKLIVAECCRNLSTVGALPVAATNNLNFGNPERPEIMAQLVEAIEGMAEACAFFETPITGGNVSLYNETLGEAIWPTPVLGIVGLMKTADPVTIPFKNEGRAVILLGGVGQGDWLRFGGTQFAKVVLNQMWGQPPELDMEYEKAVQQAIREVIAEGLAESAHDLSDGGLAVALVECSFGGIGAAIELDSPLRPELLLFHEGPSRILVSTAEPARIHEIARKFRVESAEIGVTMKGALRIRNGSATLIEAGTDRLRAIWDGALENSLGPQHV
jgi:phosphoribosylformylglycinamidine synthase